MVRRRFEELKKMTNEKRIEIEKRIAGQVIADALAEGYTIDVNDGGETTLRKSSSKRTILEAMFSTDHDILTLRTGVGGRVGSIMFVYGNGAEVISDYTDKPEIERVLTRACATADKISA
jgi:hypothetical protein